MEVAKVARLLAFGLTLLALVAPHLVEGSIGSCKISPLAPAYVLPNTTWGPASYGMCQPGWYCPNSRLDNQSTWPAICPPTDECISKRLDYQFCEPQGEFEPMPCPGGWYCPNATTKIRCPKGYSCILGSTSPKKCQALSFCQEGSSNEYEMSGILIALLLDLVVVVIVLVYKFVQRSIDRETSDKEAAATPEDGASPVIGKGKRWTDVTEDLRQAFYNHYLRARGDDVPLTFTAQDLSVTIPETKKSAEKILLNGVTGKFRPGHVTAIMGPSGAGKTLFLSSILGKLNPDWKLEGELKVNGALKTQDVRHVVGFVPQQDILHKELTVEQNLYFASETRLPSHWTAEEKEELRDSVLHALGIAHVRNVQIGDESSRGVSGGQRKRCSIGLELASAPTALFLDEPTTGLDAATAYDLCGLLKNVADATKMTVGMVIHQPRVEIWEALDEVLFLAPGGRTVYQGPQKDAQSYFESAIGLDFTNGNPADVILDGIAANADAAIKAWGEKLEEDIRQGGIMSATGDDVETAVPVARGASFIRQVELNHRRSLLKQYKRWYTLILDVLMGMVASILMGTAAIRDSYVGIVRDEYILLSPKQKMWLVPMLTLLYHLSIASSVAPAGVRTFGSEQMQYWREASAGHSRLAYFIGYSVADIYRIVLGSVHFSLIAYLMWEPIQAYGSFFLCIFLIFMCVDSLAALLSMWLRPDSAPLLATVIAVCMSLLNGYPTIPVINPISYAWWSSEAIVTQNVDPVSNIYNNAQIEDQWFYSLGQYGTDLVVLILMYIIYRILAFILMIALNREKQR